MAKQKRIEEPANIQLRPVASPVSTFVTPAGQAPVAPTPGPGPAPLPTGPNASQQYASALTQYGDQLASFSPRLDVLKAGIEDAFNPMIKHRNEQAAAAGEAMVLDSQKTMAQLVADGEIDVEDNPWLIYGARKASGYLAAGAWERHVNIKYNEMITKDPAMTELQWDRAYKEMQAEFVSTSKMTDPFEAQVFHSAARASKQRTDAKIVQHASAHRKHVVKTATTTGVINTLGNFGGELKERRRDNRQKFILTADAEGNLVVDPNRPLTHNGKPLSPEESEAHQAVSLNLVENMQGQIEALIQTHGETFGLSGNPDAALETVGTQIASLLSDPETYDPVLEAAWLNMRNPDGTRLTAGGHWGALERSTREARLAASETLTKADIRGMEEWLIAHPDSGKEEFLEFASSNITTSERTLNALSLGYWELREKNNGWGVLDPQKKSRIHHYFASNRAISYEEWLMNLAGQEGFGDTVVQGIAGGDPVLLTEMGTRAFFDRYSGQYWEGTMGTDALIDLGALENSIVTESRSGMAGGSGPTSMGEIASRLAQGTDLSPDTPEFNKQLIRITNRVNDERFFPTDTLTSQDESDLMDFVDKAWAEGAPLGPPEYDEEGKPIPGTEMLPPGTVWSRDITNLFIEKFAPDATDQQKISLRKYVRSYQEAKMPKSANARTQFRHYVLASSKNGVEAAVTAGMTQTGFNQWVRDHFTDEGSDSILTHNGVAYSLVVAPDNKSMILQGPTTADDITIPVGDLWEQGMQNEAERLYAPHNRITNIEVTYGEDGQPIRRGVRERWLEAKKAKEAGDSGPLESLTEEFPYLKAIGSLKDFSRVEGREIARIFRETGQIPQVIADDIDSTDALVKKWRALPEADMSSLSEALRLTDTMRGEGSDEAIMGKVGEILAESGEALDVYRQIMGGTDGRSLVEILDLYDEAHRDNIGGELFTGETFDLLEGTSLVWEYPEHFGKRGGQRTGTSIRLETFDIALRESLHPTVDSSLPPLKTTVDAKVRDSAYVRNGAGRTQLLADIGRLADRMPGFSTEEDRAAFIEDAIERNYSRHTLGDWSIFGSLSPSGTVEGGAAEELEHAIWIPKRWAERKLEFVQDKDTDYITKTILDHEMAGENATRPTYESFLIDAIENANTEGTPLRGLIMQQSGMTEEELVGAINVAPLLQNTPRGNIPESFEIHFMTPDGTKTTTIVDLKLNDMLESHIQSHPTVADEYKAFAKSGAKYMDAFNRIHNTGELGAEEFFAEFGTTQGKEDFRMFHVYYNNLGPKMRERWDKFTPDHIKERLANMGEE